MGLSRQLVRKPCCVNIKLAIKIFDNVYIFVKFFLTNWLIFCLGCVNIFLGKTRVFVPQTIQGDMYARGKVLYY